MRGEVHLQIWKYPSIDHRWGHFFSKIWPKFFISFGKRVLPYVSTTSKYAYASFPMKTSTIYFEEKS